MFRRFHITVEEVRGCKVYTLSRREGQSTEEILYLHGGAYVSDIMALQWRLLGKLLDRMDVSITVPLYPLAPEATIADALPFLEEVYGVLAAQSISPVSLLGDSAGGGLAVALAARLQGQQLAQPSCLVLLSPWLDVTCSDPALAALNRVDPILAPEALRMYGEWWAGPLGTKHPFVSPLYGDCSGLPPMLVFTGTHDLLHADSLRLQAHLAANAGNIQLTIYPAMLHVWPTLPVPEAKQALVTLISYLSQARTSSHAANRVEG